MKKLSLLLVMIMAVSLYAQGNFSRSSVLEVQTTSISDASYGPWRYDRVFSAGEKAYVNIKVRGFQPGADNRYRIQADLRIPSLRINTNNIINGSINAMEWVPMNFHVNIKSVTRGGRVNVYVRIRDMVAGTYTTTSEWFLLRQ